MRSRERLAWIALTLGLATAWLTREHATTGATTPIVRPRTPPGVRLSMDQLHQHGGVPLRWQMSPPPGDIASGRQIFADLGCPSCHRIEGETFNTDDASKHGPDLSGMGGHHPAGYFIEAILNPDAVLIDGAGYIGADGRSKMPMYPEMTASQLADLVAYLTSLKQAGTPSCHGGESNTPISVTLSSIDLNGRPQPTVGEARSFFTQTYEILPGQMKAFEAWFKNEGVPQFQAADGFVSIETFVDATRPGNGVTSRFAFRDEAALRNFMGDPATIALWNRFDSFVGPHSHVSTAVPPVYRADTLSTR